MFIHSSRDRDRSTSLGCPNVVVWPGQHNLKSIKVEVSSFWAFSFCSLVHEICLKKSCYSLKRKCQFVKCHPCLPIVYKLVKTSQVVVMSSSNPELHTILGRTWKYLESSVYWVINTLYRIQYSNEIMVFMSYLFGFFSNKDRTNGMYKYQFPPLWTWNLKELKNSENKHKLLAHHNIADRKLQIYNS